MRAKRHGGASQSPTSKVALSPSHFSQRRVCGSGVTRIVGNAPSKGELVGARRLHRRSMQRERRQARRSLRCDHHHQLHYGWGWCLPSRCPRNWAEAPPCAAACPRAVSPRPSAFRRPETRGALPHCRGAASVVLRIALASKNADVLTEQKAGTPAVPSVAASRWCQARRGVERDSGNRRAGALASGACIAPPTPSAANAGPLARQTAGETAVVTAVDTTPQQRWKIATNPLHPSQQLTNKRWSVDVIE